VSSSCWAQSEVWATWVRTGERWVRAAREREREGEELRHEKWSVRGLEGGEKTWDLVMLWKREEGEERRQESAMVRDLKAVAVIDM